ncbi:MAG: MBOAT family O-acyltransferase [Candidatus Sumerlaeia bacterium]|nr:MBOAT family O-acyltransferase [Candidatus Sumerlaeia bacterium]
MVFTSWAFVLFLPIVLLLNAIWPKRWRHHMLLVASYVFYGWWDWRFLSLVIFTTWLDWFVALLIQACHDRRDPAQAKRWITFSVVMNLAVLGFFKYAGFFADMVEPLAQLFGLDPAGWAARIVLPLGISFYTFQSMSYTIDVYRRDMPAERSFVKFALFVTYFPQLVAGPIERPQNLIPQLDRPEKVNLDMVREGLGLMVLGFFKKMVLSTIVQREADVIFSEHARHQAAIALGESPIPIAGPLLMCALYLFTAQIYLDFSGYTDIARGCARFFGVRLMKNFEQPYVSTNMTEFWQRWHISLSSWFRDYLYRPIKGSRKGERIIIFSQLATMTIAGFWHGATWAFIAWGFYHGLFLALERIWNRFLKKKVIAPGTSPRLLGFVGWVYVIHVVAFSLAFFRNQHLDLALTHIAGVFTWSAFPPDRWPTLVYTVLGLGTAIAIQREQRRCNRDDFFMAWPELPQTICIGAMVVMVLYFSDQAGAPFIYFQF